MNKKTGISLIILVITIIVMIILATAIILSMENNNVIDKANTAKDKSNIATVKEYVSYVTIQNLKKDGKVDFESIKKELEKKEEIKDITITNKKLSYTVNEEESYIDSTGSVVEGHAGILPQGEWNISMKKGSGNGNILNVKIKGRKITLNSEDIISAGFQSRNCCLVITNDVKNMSVDDGGDGQIPQSLDKKITYPLVIDDVVNYGVKYINGNIENGSGVTLRFANNADGWWKLKMGKTLNNSLKSESVSTINIDQNVNYTGIYFTRFDNVKFTNYTFELSYKVNGEEIL